MNGDFRAISDEPTHPRARTLLVGVISFNLLLMAVSLTEWFSGTERSAGAADKVFGHIRIGGFRVDFAWLMFSTAAFFLAGLVFVVRSRSDRDARVDAVLCAANVLAFLLYILHVIYSGRLYFG